MLDRIALILVIIGALNWGLSACSATTLWLTFSEARALLSAGSSIPWWLWPVSGASRSSSADGLPRNYDPLRACPRPAAFPAAAAAGFFIGRTSGILSEVFLNFL